jgi:hypothetical protein
MGLDLTRVTAAPASAIQAMRPSQVDRPISAEWREKREKAIISAS